jgi:hypothetical protein
MIDGKCEYASVGVWGWVMCARGGSANSGRSSVHRNASLKYYCLSFKCQAKKGAKDQCDY